MVQFGLDLFINNIPDSLRKKRVGVVCHAASITSSYNHIIDVLSKHPECRLSAIFGPQHGLYGQTQDNMIEWEGAVDTVLNIPVFSLYGKVRKPTPRMLEGLDALIFDVQDVGARPYTYIWTLKLCMEACMERGIPVWVLDRPNPVGCVPMDGPMLDPEFYSFVGGAEIPLCHRLTMGELAVLLQRKFFSGLDLNVVWMQGWWRNSFWPQTGLPWVLPSPNMPTADTAVVYPGMVLLEATNVSEGRGTTRPFEIFGAPYIDIKKFKTILCNQEPGGCIFREHGFIPTFQKWQGTYCNGMQIHVTSRENFYPVATAVAILSAAVEASDGAFKFKDPPYEYETVKMPFDILAGSTALRTAILDKIPLREIQADWALSYGQFTEDFNSISHYPEDHP